MNLPILLPIISTIFFGILAVFYSLREEKVRKILRVSDISRRQNLYEIAILKEIQDRVGYSFDAEKVIDVITGSIRTLISYSTTSSLLVRDHTWILKNYLEEGVSQEFLTAVKNSMSASVTALSGESPNIIKETVSGVVVDSQNHKELASYFHIPLMVNERVVGLITIASTKQNIYKEEDMLTLYRIANQAALALSRLENVLSIEKEKLNAMIASLVDGVFMVDMNSQLLMMNQATKNYLKIMKDDPTIIDILKAMPNTYNFGLKIQQAILENKTIAQKEVQISNSFFEIYITPVLKPLWLGIEQFDSPLQTVIGASILIHDVTLEKSAERMKEDFTNIIVHELRSPVTAIKAASQFIISDNNKLQDEDRRKMLLLINNQAIKLLDDIALILDAAKLQAGLFTLQKVDTDLAKLIAEKLNFFRPEADSKHIELSENMQPDLPLISVDPIHTSQVINNLLSNSLKFTPIGGKISITAAKENDSIRVSVIDNGSGIAKDKQSSLFEKFSQVQTPNAHVGTGLGLYIVKGIVQAHGGTVSLTSDLGVGTIITFTLPLHPHPNETAVPQSMTQPITN